MKSLNKVFSVFFAFFIALFSACQKESYPVAVSDPITEITVVEDHSEVFVEWMKRGYKNRVLVNVDHHDDLRYIPEHKIRKLKQLYAEKKWDEILSERDRGVQSLYTLADFIYAAHRLGIVKKLYWVSPAMLLETDDIERGAKALLRAFGYPEEMIATFHRDGRAVTGNIFGIEITISSIKNLPEIKAPVLLTIDVDYFPNSMRKRKTGELKVIKDFFSYLKNKRIKVQHLSIAYSVNGGYTDAIDRHIGDEVTYLFEHPEIIDNMTYPELWKIRDKGFGLLRSGHGEDALNVFHEAMNSFHNEPTMLLGKALSLTFIERDDEALNTIKSIIKISPEYDYAYIFIGKKIGHKGGVERAKRYLDEYLKRHPNSHYGLMAYADMLYDNARDAEALKLYQKVLLKGEYISAVMYAGDALVHLGRYQEAMKYYERGLKLLDEVGYKSLRNYPESVRNMNILKTRLRK